MFTANITERNLFILLTLQLYLVIPSMHLVGNNSSMQPTPLWSAGKFTFLHDLNV